ncbi:MAG TPA: LUD domain-containing protein [Planctomycetaceae bacterium]|nr:LUD domain-containing protein [Planctomycetaceae bacterium]
MTVSKQTILSAIRRHHLPEAPLPSLDQAWITFADPRQQFVSVLESVGGRAVFVPDVAALNAELAAMPAWVEARKVVSLVEGVRPELPGRGIDLGQLDDPHATEDIDFAVLPGEFAVAENGAVWITDVAVKHRVIFFIAQHLALVVPAADVVQNMHEAYGRLSFESPGFGGFISGPSKTADIEQSLVIGAHGPRSTTVFLIG